MTSWNVKTQATRVALAGQRRSAQTEHDALAGRLHVLELELPCVRPIDVAAPRPLAVRAHATTSAPSNSPELRPVMIVAARFTASDASLFVGREHAARQAVQDAPRQRLQVGHRRRGRGEPLVGGPPALGQRPGQPADGEKPRAVHRDAVHALVQRRQQQRQPSWAAARPSTAPR